MIFVELPRHLFEVVEKIPSHLVDMPYLFTNGNLRNQDIPLEFKCLRNYSKYHDVNLIPVDIDVSSTLSEDVNEMFATFNKDDDYKKLVLDRLSLIKENGFVYLNSDEYMDFFEKIEIAEKNIVETHMDKNKLLHTYKLFQEENFVTRENAMLENIYNYSKENQYNQAVFLIGAGHRKSIIPKIIEYEKKSEMKLNWQELDLWSVHYRDRK